MKTVNRNKMRQVISAILILLISTSLVFAYPPDNAAVLYYRASLSYTTNSTMEKKLSELIKGNIGIDEEIKAYVQRNKIWIKQFVDAGEAPHCDWGIDYSEGFATLMPPYAPLRNLAKIVLAQAKITAESKDYKKSLDLCLSVHKASNHIADGGLLISHLVGISLNEMANQGIVDILPHISNDPDILIWLRGQVFDVSGKVPQMKTALNKDIRIFAQDIRKEKADYVLELAGDNIPKEQAQIIRQANETFFKANKEYLMEHLASLLTAIDLPYPQSYEQLVKLGERPGGEIKKNPYAIMTACLAPALQKIYNHDVHRKTSSNALKTALEIYIINAQTGKLPDLLPAGLPKDLFSGKPFQYAKTAEGFILRCQGRDLDKDEIHEYEFKIKK